MKAIFCGNFEFDARQSDVERLFRRYGRVNRVDMKSGFAFVYMDDERDAEDAIQALDRREFGRKGRRLRVEWTKHERRNRKAPSSRRSAANLRPPSKTLFVINFPHLTRARDLERHFDPYGKIANVRIRRNFAFVQYELQDDATRALDATNLSKLLDRIISVEYASQDDDKKRKSYSPDGRRSHERSPDRRRSPSPYTRERGSSDYGHGPSPASYRRERSSSTYSGRTRTSCGSPRHRDRTEKPNSRMEKIGPDYGDHASRSRSPSPHKEKMDPDQYGGHATSGSPLMREKSRPDHRQSCGSPNYPCLEERVCADFLDSSSSPQSVGRLEHGNDNDDDSTRIISLDQSEEVIMTEYDGGAIPDGGVESGESPVKDYRNPVDNGYTSPSPSSAHE